MAVVSRTGPFYSGTIADSANADTDEYVPWAGARPVFYVNSNADVTVKAYRIGADGIAHEVISVAVVANVEERIAFASPLRHSKLNIANASGGPAVVTVAVDEED